MKPIDLFKALKKAAHDERYPLHLYELPVSVGEDNGKMPLLQAIDLLYSEGEILETTQFGIEFESEESGYSEAWVPLSEITINGEPEIL
jgi:hypothetical protein